MRPIVQSNCFLAFGVIIGIISIAMMASFNAIYKKVLNNMLVIDQDADIYDVYTEPEVPMNLDFYFFNVTNPKEIKNEGAKPNLVEIGPYRYLEKVKKNGTFNHTAGTFKYRQSTWYFFDEENSVGKEDDLITTINPILLVLGAELYGQPKTKLFPIWRQLDKMMSLFDVHSVGEMLFGGYEFPEISVRISENETYNGTCYGLSCELLDQCIEFLEPNRFGYFYGQNGSNDGLYEVYTGEDGMDNYLFVKEWNGDDQLHFWGYNGSQDDPYCNMINGTDGTQFPPGVKKTDLIQLFTTDLCRSIDFLFESEVKVIGIVDSLRFIAPSEMLESGHSYPNNLCYCVPIPDQDDPCLHNAMMNMAPCLGGAPLVLSTPHFYEGTDEDIHSVEGLKPEKEKHETYLDIEPTTGVVVRGAKRIQLNLPLKQYGSLSTFRHVPEVMFPILWADENAVIPEDDANDLNDALTIPYLIVYIVFSITLIIAVIFIIIGYILRRRIKKNTKAGLLMN